MLTVWVAIAIASLFITPVALIGAFYLYYKRNPTCKKLLHVAAISLGFLILAMVFAR